MRKPYRIQVAVAMLALASLSCGLSAQEPELANEDDKVLYALGLAIAQQITQIGITEGELALVQRGLADSVLGRTPQVDLNTYGPKLQGFAQARMAARTEIEKVASAEFLAQEAAKAGAATTDSGLVISEITAGTGASPAATDRVKVHYRGTLRDGSVFDSSIDRGQPAEFGLDQVVPCWTEGLQLMKVGGKSRLVCPAALAYGDQGRPGIPGGAALVFEVELLEIVPAAGS
jgi:FKBP-type peptidyl-prolyl cis-trans isomerase